jgi:hypothetical protein
MAEDVRACGYVVGEADVAVAVEGDEVHGPGVQIDATAESVLLGVETHGITPEVRVGA